MVRWISLAWHSNNDLPQTTPALFTRMSTLPNCLLTSSACKENTDLTSEHVQTLSLEKHPLQAFNNVLPLLEHCHMVQKNTSDGQIQNAI